MSEDDQKRSFSWTSVAAIAGLVAGPIVLYVLLPRAGEPAALAAGVIVAVAFKHLGLLTVVLAPVYAILRRMRPPTCYREAGWITLAPQTSCLVRRL